MRKSSLTLGLTRTIYFTNIYQNKFEVIIVDDSEIIEAYDINGTVIETGTRVKYINTDTVGVVTDIKRDSDGEWALVDKTDLYYNVKALEVTDAEIKADVGEHEATATDAAQYLKKQAEAMGSRKFEDVSSSTGGG